jgi:hypothetical protein
MEEVRSCETSQKCYEPTWNRISEERSLHSSRREKVKFEGDWSRLPSETLEIYNIYMPVTMVY